MDTACFGGKKSEKRWKRKNGASLNLHRQTDPSVRQWFEWGIVLGVPFIN